MDFDTWLDNAWTEHATDAEAVARRIGADGLALASTDAQHLALARLTHHVHGEHLARWQAGRESLAHIAGRVADEAAGHTLRVLDASLSLAEGSADPRPAFDGSDRLRVTAQAAGALAAHDATRAALLLDEALAQADAAELADNDPAVRALAAAGNGIACAMEEKQPRSDAERDLMIQAARTARRFWARAGTWLEVERAEYRLAMSFVQAADPAQARLHAQACLEIVREHEAPALEHFFAWEALAVVERAAGNPTGHAHALVQARGAFAGLDPADIAWCRPVLDKLAA